MRSAFDSFNLISGVHTFMSAEDNKYKNILPPLGLLNEIKKKKLMSKLKELEFFPKKNKAA